MDKINQIVTPTNNELTNEVDGFIKFPSTVLANSDIFVTDKDGIKSVFEELNKQTVEVTNQNIKAAVEAVNKNIPVEVNKLYNTTIKPNIQQEVKDATKNFVTLSKVTTEISSAVGEAKKELTKSLESTYDNLKSITNKNTSDISTVKTNVDTNTKNISNLSKTVTAQGNSIADLKKADTEINNKISTLEQTVGTVISTGEENLKKGLEAVGNHITSEITKVTTDVNNKFQQLDTKLKQDFESNLTSAKDYANQIGTHLDGLIDTINDTIQQQTKALSETQTKVDSLSGSLVIIPNRLDKTSAELEAMTEADRKKILDKHVLDNGKKAVEINYCVITKDDDSYIYRPIGWVLHRDKPVSIATENNLGTVLSDPNTEGNVVVSATGVMTVNGFNALKTEVSNIKTSVTDNLKEAKKYTDEREVEIKKEIQTVSSSVTDVTNKVTTNTNNITTLEGKVSTLETTTGDIKTTVGKHTTSITEFTENFTKLDTHLKGLKQNNDDFMTKDYNPFKAEVNKQLGEINNKVGQGVASALDEAKLEIEKAYEKSIQQSAANTTEDANKYSDNVLVEAKKYADNLVFNSGNITASQVDDKIKIAGEAIHTDYTSAINTVKQTVTQHTQSANEEINKIKQTTSQLSTKLDEDVNNLTKAWNQVNERFNQNDTNIGIALGKLKETVTKDFQQADEATLQKAESKTNELIGIAEGKIKSTTDEITTKVNANTQEINSLKSTVSNNNSTLSGKISNLETKANEIDTRSKDNESAISQLKSDLGVAFSKTEEKLNKNIKTVYDNLTTSIGNTTTTLTGHMRDTYNAAKSYTDTKVKEVNDTLIKVSAKADANETAINKINSELQHRDGSLVYVGSVNETADQVEAKGTGKDTFLNKVVTDSGRPAPKDMYAIRTKDDSTYYYINNQWVLKRVYVVAQATDTTLGIIKGSTLEGHGSIQGDGSVKVVGFDALKTSVTKNLEEAKKYTDSAKQAAIKQAATDAENKVNALKGTLESKINSNTSTISTITKDLNDHKSKTVTIDTKQDITGDKTFKGDVVIDKGPNNKTVFTIQGDEDNVGIVINPTEVANTSLEIMRYRTNDRDFYISASGGNITINADPGTQSVKTSLILDASRVSVNVLDYIGIGNNDSRNYISLCPSETMGEDITIKLGGRVHVEQGQAGKTIRCIFDAENKRSLVNLGDPTQDGDPVTLRYFKANANNFTVGYPLVKNSGTLTLDYNTNDFKLDANKLKLREDAGVIKALKDKDASLEQTLNSKANDNQVVKLTGDQSVGGTKTFTSPVVVPTPTSDTHATNRGEVNRILGNYAKLNTANTFTANQTFITNNDTTILTLKQGANNKFAYIAIKNMSNSNIMELGKFNQTKDEIELRALNDNLWIKAKTKTIYLESVNLETKTTENRFHSRTVFGTDIRIGHGGAPRLRPDSGVKFLYFGTDSNTYFKIDLENRSDLTGIKDPTNDRDATPKSWVLSQIRSTSVTAPITNTNGSIGLSLKTNGGLKVESNSLTLDLQNGALKQELDNIRNGTVKTTGDQTVNGNKTLTGITTFNGEINLNRPVEITSANFQGDRILRLNIDSETSVPDKDLDLFKVHKAGMKAYIRVGYNKDGLKKFVMWSADRKTRVTGLPSSTTDDQDAISYEQFRTQGIRIGVQNVYDDNKVPILTGRGNTALRIRPNTTGEQGAIEFQDVNGTVLGRIGKLNSGSMDMKVTSQGSGYLYLESPQKVVIATSGNGDIDLNPSGNGKINFNGKVAFGGDITINRISEIPIKNLQGDWIFRANFDGVTATGNKSVDLFRIHKAGVHAWIKANYTKDDIQSLEISSMYRKTRISGLPAATNNDQDAISYEQFRTQGIRKNTENVHGNNQEPIIRGEGDRLLTFVSSVNKASYLQFEKQESGSNNQITKTRYGIIGKGSSSNSDFAIQTFAGSDIKITSDASVTITTNNNRDINLNPNGSGKIVINGRAELKKEVNMYKPIEAIMNGLNGSWLLRANLDSVSGNGDKNTDLLRIHRAGEKGHIRMYYKSSSFDKLEIWTADRKTRVTGLPAVTSHNEDAISYEQFATQGLRNGVENIYDDNKVPVFIGRGHTAIKVKSLDNSKAAAIEFNNNGNGRVGRIGKLNVSSNDFIMECSGGGWLKLISDRDIEINSTGNNGSIKITPHGSGKTIINGNVEFKGSYIQGNRDVRLGTGGGVVNITPEDNSEKELRFSNTTLGNNNKFKINLENKITLYGIKTPTASDHVTSKDYVDKSIQAAITAHKNLYPVFLPRGTNVQAGVNIQPGQIVFVC